MLGLLITNTVNCDISSIDNRYWIPYWSAAVWKRNSGLRVKCRCPADTDRLPSNLNEPNGTSIVVQLAREDAQKAGFAPTITPFNGEHHGGVQVLNSSKQSFSSSAVSA
jgi:hypothetical protein